MKPVISVVIPAYNEEGCLDELHRRLKQVLLSIGLEYEILFVDDGSRDGTFEDLRRLRKADPCVRALRLSRNFGHQAALSAGLAHARGQAVVTMDADLQHPPELLPELVARWKEGHEVVFTIREDNAGATASKDFTSGFYYRLLNFLSPIPVVPGAADFRLLDRKAVDALNAMPERARFFRGLVPWIGFRQTQVVFHAPERFAGKTKYSYRKMMQLALHGILSLSALPLRLATLVGALVVLLGFIYGVYVVWTAFTNPESQRGWASIQMMVLLLGGTQLIFLGIIGEYLARVFDEVKARPLFLVAESLEDPEREVSGT
jgi:dolichol-phosphate mannosyltransferase